MKNLVTKLQIFADLIRFKNQTGVWLLLLPGLWVICMLAQEARDFLWAPIFFCGAFAMRSAGCIINDIADKNFDSRVKRTKSRPLASGRLGVIDSLLPLLLFLLVGLVILILIGKKAMLLGIIMMALIVLYPFAKRFLKYPQVLLAVIFNSAALFASIALKGHINLAAALIYVGSFFWIIYYDTIYAHQDKIYDKDLNLYSMALTPFGTKRWLAIYYKLTVFFWFCAGVLSGLNPVYYMANLALFWFFYKQLQELELEDPDCCMKAFNFNKKIGFILLFAILLGKL